MQAAADSNQRAGLVGRTRGTLSINEGMTVTETVLLGRILSTEYAAGQPVHSELEPAPTEHPIAASDAITVCQVPFPAVNHLSAPLLYNLFGICLLKQIKAEGKPNNSASLAEAPTSTKIVFKYRRKIKAKGKPNNSASLAEAPTSL